MCHLNFGSPLLGQGCRLLWHRSEICWHLIARIGRKLWSLQYVALSDPGVIWDFTIIWSKQAICCAFFGSEIFSLTFLDILNANLSEIETRISHLKSYLFVFLQYLCRKVVRPNWHQNTKYLQIEWFARIWECHRSLSRKGDHLEYKFHSVKVRVRTCELLSISFCCLWMYSECISTYSKSVGRINRCKLIFSWEY